MDGKHPKRRRDKDNPYAISIDKDHCYISFTDGQGVLRRLEIDQSLYSVFDRFELDDLVYLNVVDRHLEQSEQTDENLNARAVHKPESVEELAMQSLDNERLYAAIRKLPDIQRRRLILSYFAELTYEQIGEIEGCSKVAVKYSIDRAILALKKSFEKNNG